MIDYGYLRDIFDYCLSVEYSHIEGGGSFATAIDKDILYVFFEKSNPWKNG